MASELQSAAETAQALAKSHPAAAPIAKAIHNLASLQASASELERQQEKSKADFARQQENAKADLAAAKRDAEAELASIIMQIGTEKAFLAALKADVARTKERLTLTRAELNGVRARLGL